MRYLLSIVISIFILTGCVQKEQVVEANIPNDKLGKPIIITAPKVEEKIEVIEDVEIEEETIPFLESNDKIKIAFVYPSKYVAKYAKPSIATILAYLSFKELDYDLKVIDTENESLESLQNTFETLKQNNYENVIALFTPRVNELLNQLELEDMRVYLPLIEKNDLVETKNNFIYGSISYEEQINKLIEYSPNDKKVMFYQDSFLGKKLKAKFDSLGIDIPVVKEIKKKRNYFRGLIRDYRLNNANIFLNTDIVKTSLILSQITANRINPSVVLSTQNNFDPKLISLTQERDRNKFIVASSIDDIDEKLLDTIEVFGGNVRYEWVDYSILVGINYLFDSNRSGLLLTEIVDNEVDYKPRLFKATDFGFIEIK